MRGGRSWAEIDLGALDRNLEAVRACVPPGVGVMAVVKADAYGHGIDAVAGRLAGRVDMFAVANLAEARRVRRVDPAARVLILGPSLPEERAGVVADRFVPSVSDAGEARAYAALGIGGCPVDIHVVIDTGMGRIGVWEEEAAAELDAILACPGVRVCGICTHLPVADEDDLFTAAQLERFEELCARLRACGLSDSLQVHALNSAGILRHGARAAGLVRAGLVLYGVSPVPETAAGRLSPVLAWKTRVALVRRVGAGRGISYGRTHVTVSPTRVATLPVGYADGYPRALSGRGAHVLVRGRRCPVLGRVTMDQIVVDVGALGGEAVVGDEVVLIGCQGEAEIRGEELAVCAGTIPWEILVGIGPRVERRAVDRHL